MAITKGTTWTSPIDFGVSEWIKAKTGVQLGPTNPAQNVQNTGLDYSGGKATAQKLISNGQIAGVTDVAPPPSTQKISSGGPNPNTIIGDGRDTSIQDLIKGQRENVQNNGEDRIRAAIGVFDAKKQGLMNRIPGLQAGLTKTLEGYDLGLQDFLANAEAEEGKRTRDIDATIGQTNEDYTRAYRSTRQTAKSLARQLRNQFASRGSLDSTQYRDMAIDQSSDIAQSLGDTRREQAGKISTFEGEKGDIQKYYAQQRDAEAKRVRIAKEQEQIRTDQLVQGILDDANLTDSQKIEAVLEKQSALDQRLSELDMREQELVSEQTKNAQELELKKAQLASKGYSNNFTTAKNTNTALKNGQAILSSYEERFGAPPTPEQAYQVFIDNGVDEETAKRYAAFLYTGGGSNDQEDPNSIATELGY